MKEETVEIEIPTGYIYDYHVRSKAEDDIIKIHLKKQTVKDFDWYVDEYLNLSIVSTCDQIRDWISKSHLMLIQDRLKTKQFSLVPWEIKIGLFKFICDDGKVDWIFQYEIYRASGICDGFPKEFLNNLFETK